MNFSDLSETDRRYSSIVADPPWAYENEKTGGSLKSGSAQQYPVMSLEDICALPVKKIAAKDSVLFLWVTTPLKDYGFEVMKAWGYTYKTTLYWEKVGILGLGFWFRGQMEECYLGVRGTVPAFRSQERNVIRVPPGQHSEKPEEFWRLIERHCRPPRIELFCREPRPGWDTFGNQVEPTMQTRL